MRFKRLCDALLHMQGQVIDIVDFINLNGVEALALARRGRL
jgi:hypothetical protein